LKDIAGDALELKISIKPGTATEIGVEVYCDQDGKGGFPIALQPTNKTLRLGDVQAPFEFRAGEKLELRVFLDKTMIEVFANDRQAMVGSHRYAAGNLGVSLFSKGGEVLVKEVKGWKMKSIYADR